MSGLILKLAPKERLLINGAVVENGDRRSRLNIITPGAAILRLRDALHPDDVTSPLRKCCYIAQLGLSGDMSIGRVSEQLEVAISELSAECVSADVRRLLSTAQGHAKIGNLYNALRVLRDLVLAEEQLDAAMCAR